MVPNNYKVEFISDRSAGRTNSGQDSLTYPFILNNLWYIWSSSVLRHSAISTESSERPHCCMNAKYIGVIYTTAVSLSLDI